MTERSLEASLAPSRSPALTALVVYLRPANRCHLLITLARMGILVVEHQGAEHALRAAYSSRTDFVIVVADDRAEHTQLAAALSERLGSPLAIVLPRASSVATAAGYIVCDDIAADAALEIGIAAVAREARALRRMGEVAAEWIVFKDIRFSPSPPSLARDRDAIHLSRSEGDLLAALAERAGRIVPSADLERRIAAGAGRRAGISPGHLKAIVKRVRRKVEQLGGEPDLLRNIRGVGYMLAA